MRNVVSILVAASALVSCERTPPPIAAKLSVSEVLTGAADPRFARADAPREFESPADHGPHPEFQSEWWYFTANLRDDAGREFGCQLTFFRRASRFDAPSSSSAWAARDIFMAHFAVSDVAAGEFHAFERFERGALELAGATGDPWRVWNRDWSASGSLDRDGTTRLVAEEDGVAIDLELLATVAPILNGERGLSRKGAAPGAASYYYSSPGMRASGELTLDGAKRRVAGSCWLDREWSTSALDAEQIGWDWFALDLGDAGHLMLYSMRRRDGRRDPHSSGTWIGSNGEAVKLASDEFEIEATARWTSPRTGSTYPSTWIVRVPSRDAQFKIVPLLADQELDLAVRYWEGAVRVEGRVDALELDSRGYVELTGYDE